MASSTPLASCPPCSDTPLAITTSAITFLTFLYALTVGLIYYYGLAKSNPKEVQKSIRLLSNSLGELQSMVQEVQQTFSKEPVEPLVEREYPEQGEGDILAALQRLFQKTLALSVLSNKIDLQNPISSRVAYWFQLVRLRYLIIREEVEQKLAEKDQLMAELRHIQQRSGSISPVLFQSISNRYCACCRIMKIKNKRAEKAFWKIHHEMLKLERSVALPRMPRYFSDRRCCNR